MVNTAFYKYGSNRSTIRDLFEYGKMREKEVGIENVYDYSLGNPSVPSPKEVNDAINDLLTTESSVKIHGYTSANGDEECRNAIAENLNSRFGTDYKASNIFMTCGAAASLISVMRALQVDGKSELIAIAPYFPEYKCFAQSNGLIFKCVSADTKAFQIDLAQLEELIGENTQAVIINSPNNPSGVIYSEETLIKLGALLTKKSKEYSHPIYLISDEPYRELVYTQEPAPFVANYYKNTIICYSYSKSLSLPGERIGYVLVPERADDSKAVMNAVAGAARCSGYVCAPSLFQKVITKCANVMPDIESYRTNRDFLCKALDEIGFEYAKPDGAFYLFIKSPDLSGKSLSETAKKHDLLLVDAAAFGCSEYVRASYCVSLDMIKNSIPAFKKTFEEITNN